MTRATRSDAVRNRQRILDAATRAFTTTGVNTSLEAIAADAGLSIGTLYNHFGDRDGLIEAALSSALQQLQAVADEASSRSEPWTAFETLIQRTCALQATDRAVADVLGNRYPPKGAVHEACSYLLERFVEIIERAKRANQLRHDFTVSDLGPIMWANACILENEPSNSDAWIRHLTFLLDGLRLEPRTGEDTHVVTPIRRNFHGRPHEG